MGLLTTTAVVLALAALKQACPVMYRYLLTGRFGRVGRVSAGAVPNPIFHPNLRALTGNGNQRLTPLAGIWTACYRAGID